LRYANDQLAKVLAFEQADERLRGIFQAINHVFAESNFPFLKPEGRQSRHPQGFAPFGSGLMAG
jgi:hypothetical protein